MFDAHAHVSFSQFDKDRSAVIERAYAAGLTGWLEVGTDIHQSEQAIALAQQHENVYAAVGIHPSDFPVAMNWSRIKSLSDQEKVVAIGEVGFDFYRGGTLADQEEPLRLFIDLAVSKDLPVIFHVRSGEDLDAHDELLRVLREYDGEVEGVIHTYSGNADQAKEYLELGMYLSFSGVLTFKNAGEIVDVARDAPLGRILVETDCPFLAPDPHRGKRNEPAYVVLVTEKLAAIRGEKIEDVKEALKQNFRTLMKI